MLKIKMMRFDHTVVFAAEELKKYLRMMMPRCGEITIAYKPDAKEGFRLGLMRDFGLDMSDAEKEEAEEQHDDLLHGQACNLKHRTRILSYLAVLNSSFSIKICSKDSASAVPLA